MLAGIHDPATIYIHNGEDKMKKSLTDAVKSIKNDIDNIKNKTIVFSSKATKN